MPRRVVDSINNADSTICVDLFVRPDGSYGFESYRRDVEDASGWFPIGGHAAMSFLGQDAALAKAKAVVAWLPVALEKRG